MVRSRGCQSPVLKGMGSLREMISQRIISGTNRMERVLFFQFYQNQYDRL